MNSYKLTSNVTFNYKLDNLDQSTLSSLYSVLGYLNILNELGKQDGQSLNWEDYYYGKIIETIRDGIEGIDKSDKVKLGHKLDKIAAGTFDIELINYPSMSLCLVFGKVFSPEDNYRKRFGGAFGIKNEESVGLLQKYDKIAENAYLRFPFIADKSREFFLKNKSEITCIDVIAFGGEFNKYYKPISIFYSGYRSEPSLSQFHVVLFTNVYYKRYKIISERLGSKFIENFYDLDDISQQTLNRILIFWLRGHDLGHFFGEDNFVDNMRDNRRIYYVLHELKSDIVSLHILKNNYEKLFDKGELEIVFMVFIAEAFRYMRRGNFLKYTDGGSAYLAYKYFLDSGAIKIKRNNVHFIDFERLSDDIDELCEKMMKIFSRGNTREALQFANRWGDLEELDTDILPKDLDFLNDHLIAFNLNISNF